MLSATTAVLSSSALPRCAHCARPVALTKSSTCCALVPQAGLPAEVADAGFKQAMQQRWIALDKAGGEPRVMRKVDSITDAVQALLADVAAGRVLAASDAEALKKRKLVKQE